MKHLHGVATMAGEDEPVFVLRASDSVAVETVRFWADLAEGEGADEEHIACVRRWADEMESWREEHGGSVPHSPMDTEYQKKCLEDRENYNKQLLDLWVNHQPTAVRLWEQADNQVEVYRRLLVHHGYLASSHLSDEDYLPERERRERVVAGWQKRCLSFTEVDEILAYIEGGQVPYSYREQHKNTT